jgi:hypothetical protein
MSLKVGRIALLGAGLWILSGHASAEDQEPRYEPQCLRVGSFAAFAEMVRMGVKTLALSAPMLPEEMDLFMTDAVRIAEEERVDIYREPELLLTDLFPAEITAGKHVLLIYRGATLEEYLSLKSEKAALERAGNYSGNRREEIAWKFGRLLSYPDPIIAERLAGPGTAE